MRRPFILYYVLLGPVQLHALANKWRGNTSTPLQPIYNRYYSQRRIAISRALSDSSLEGIERSWISHWPPLTRILIACEIELSCSQPHI